LLVKNTNNGERKLLYAKLGEPYLKFQLLILYLSNFSNLESMSYSKQKSQAEDLIRFTTIALLTFYIVFVLVITYFSWIWAIPTVYKSNFIKGLPVIGWILIFLSAIAPLLVVLFVVSNSKNVFIDALAKQLRDNEEEINEKNAQFDRERVAYETKLDSADNQKLIPLLQYSSYELDIYHKIGSRQAAKSYRNSIVAMWLGFGLIILGILVSIFHFSDSIKLMTSASGIIIEVISALFLWIYKTSISQMNYFYARQLFIHNSVLAFQMAQTMTAPDKSKELIIDKILAFGFHTFGANDKSSKKDRKDENNLKNNKDEKDKNGKNANASTAPPHP
jgi:uncharacterized membrane protein (DUF485 family)